MAQEPKKMTQQVQKKSLETPRMELESQKALQTTKTGLEIQTRAQEPMKMKQLNQMTLEEPKRMSQQIQRMAQETLKTGLRIQTARQIRRMARETLKAAQGIPTVQESRTALEAMETAQQIQRMPRKKQAQRPMPRVLQSCQVWMEASRQSQGRYHNRWPRERYHRDSGH
jgi:hypothetical protein